MKPYNEWRNDRYKRLIIDHTIDEANFPFSLEAYKGGMAEALRWFRDAIAQPATTISWLAAEDDTGDAVRWSDVERICDTKLAELEVLDD